MDNDNSKIAKAALLACDQAEKVMENTIMGILAKNDGIIKPSERDIALYPVYVTVIDDDCIADIVQLLSVRLNGENIYIETGNGKHEVTVNYEIMYIILQCIENGYLITK